MTDGLSFAPLISVLLPTRNRLDLAKGAIETVRRQAYGNWELVVADNCSDEDVGAYVERLGDPRIRCTRSETFLPVTENWNRAVDAAEGDYVVMLGDDDGLVPGYFERVVAALDVLGRPDLLYHGAYHFTFPEAIPGQSEGRLSDETSRACFLAGRRGPSLLAREEAEAAARRALGMEMVYGFNMQYFLFGRAMLERLRGYGGVFQGPYPDFYAANMALLLADRIGILPEPMTIIGISPKSFGHFYFSGREREGTGLLNNEGYLGALPDGLRRRLLPGTDMNTHWLVSVSLVQRHLDERFGLSLGVERYRKMQILAALRGSAGKTSLATLWPLLSGGERVFAALAYALLKVLGPLKMPALAVLRRLMGKGAHHRPVALACPYRTMIDVFEGLR